MRKISYLMSLLFVFSVPFEAMVEYPSLGSISRVTGIILAACWLISAVLERHIRRPKFFHTALSIFVAVNIASLLWSVTPERTTTGVLTWIQILLLSLIFWDLYTSQKAVLSALQMYVLGTYVLLGDTLVNFFSGNAYYYDRFSAAGTNPDDLGVMLALGIPVAAYLAVFRPSDRLSLPLKVLNSAYVVAAIAGIALSATRTAVLVATPGAIFALMLVMHLKYSAQIRVGLLLLIAGSLVIPQIPQTSFQRLETIRSEMAGGDLNGRVRIWREGFASFERNPMLGVGSNSFRTINSEGKVAHNSFISVLVELGLTGFLLFLAVIITASIHIFSQPFWKKRLWLCLFAGWILGASALTWEYRKPTWLFLNLIVASACIVRTQNESAETDALPVALSMRRIKGEIARSHSLQMK